MRRPPPGTTFLESLDRGAIFETALVRYQDGRELVAKRVAVQLDERPEGARALDREREVLVALGGIHLPRLVEDGTDEAGPFLLETVAPGIRVRDIVSQGPLPADEWLATARSLARALAALQGAADDAGELGFVHGDISPDNVFVHPERGATFIDMSNATFRGAPATVFPGGRGTLPYAAPELARSEQAPDAATDLYALSAVLLALAVGPITEAEAEAGRLLEVGTQGLQLGRMSERADIPEPARRAVVDALRFHRQDRLLSAKHLEQRLFLLEEPA
jgi:eukaryotic-like serine/threonine-protein kinase